MGRTATVSCNGSVYTISSDGEFLTCFAHYYWYDADGDGECQYTAWQGIVYSGNAPIVITIKKGDEEYRTTTVSTDEGFARSLDGLAYLRIVDDPVEHNGFDATYIGEEYPESTDMAVGTKDALTKLSVSNSLNTSDVAFGWTDGVGSINTTPLVMPRAKEGWNCTAHIKLKAKAVEWYTLGYKLYVDGDVVKEGTELSDISVVYKIPNATVGESTYQAEVTYTLNGSSTSVVTNPITVSVIDYDYDSYNPDTGEDATGVIAPGVIYPTFPDNPDPEAPVGTFDLKSWITGFVFGLTGNSLPIDTEEVSTDG